MRVYISLPYGHAESGNTFFANIIFDRSFVAVLAVITKEAKFVADLRKLCVPYDVAANGPHESCNQWVAARVHAFED